MNSAPNPDLLEQAIAAMDAGDAEHAYPLASTLCKTAPENFAYRHIAGIAALDTNRGEDAIQHFKHAIRLAPSLEHTAAAWCGLGQAYLLFENPQEAEAAFRRALSLTPLFGPASAGLADAVERQGRHYEAEQIGKHALELGVNDPRLHVALGHAYLGQERLEEAEAEFDAALKLEPEAPEPRFGIGSIAKIHGRIDEADRIYREVLTRVPAYPGYDQFAGLKHFEPDDPDLRWLEERFALLPEDASAGTRVDLHFALAKVYDDMGDIERAIRHLEAGNELERERMHFDPERDEERMQRIMNFMTSEFMARYPDAGLTGVCPMFVVSLPRSGSTLTEQMLASHSQVRGGGELGYLPRIATELGARWAAHPEFPEMEIASSAAELREAAREYMSLTAALRLVHPYFTDKSLNNFLYIGLIHMMMPGARIIHVRRHPLATALGLYRQRFARGIGYNSDLGHIVRHYRAYAKLMEHWRATVPKAFIEVHYEALVASPEYELRRMLEYIGLEFEPACLEFYKLHRPVRTASVTQVRQPLNTLGLTRHERYRQLLAPVAEGLADEIAAYEEALSAAVRKATPSPKTG